MNLNQREVKPLTSLRFFIALYVFFFHMQINWPFIHEIFVSNVLYQGAVGMTFFFMLSGFILAMHYQEKDVKKYAVARFSRIYPIYFFAALVTVPWIGVSSLALWSHGFSLKFLLSFFLVFLNIFLLQAWFPLHFPFGTMAEVGQFLPKLFSIFVFRLSEKLYRKLANLVSLYFLDPIWP